MSDYADGTPINASQVIGQILDTDPYLQYQPSFAYTLPIQLLANGITLTLLVVLLIHLLFTTQYHYPLAPLNYVLQLSSILVVLLSVAIKVIVILRHCAVSGDHWPYDLDYVAVTIPGTDWSTGKNVAWFLLQALNNGLSNISHIQFLTLLYPSRIEARLIIFVLGPLALTSSGLVFSALSARQTVLDISDAIRNVFNSTLLLIFTISLVIWGLLVNRRRAWRWDGGTAVFGFGSLFLAFVSTSFNFVAVAEDGIEWLQHLLFAAVLWQVWLGWWWWVGSGMGIGEVEDIMERAERKKRKAAKAASRARSAGGQTGTDAGVNGRTRASSLAGIATGVTSILRSSRSGTATLTRRLTNRTEGGDDQHAAEEGAIELDDLGGEARPSSRLGSGEGGPRVEFDVAERGSTGGEGSRAGRPLQSTNSETSSTSATPSIHRPRTLGQLLALPTTLLVVSLRRLRRAHEEATKVQALGRAEKRQKVFTDADGGEPPGSSRRVTVAGQQGGEDEGGWGLGRFGIREHEQSAARLRTADERLTEERLLPARHPHGDAGKSHAQTPRTAAEEDNEWEDIDSSNSSSGAGASRAQRPTVPPNQRNKGPGTGWSWWGPLRDWRLADRSVF